jgi:hypothetical protein
MLRRNGLCRWETGHWPFLNWLSSLREDWIRHWSCDIIHSSIGWHKKSERSLRLLSINLHTNSRVFNFAFIYNV